MQGMKGLFRDEPLEGTAFFVRTRNESGIFSGLVLFGHGDDSQEPYMGLFRYLETDTSSADAHDSR